MNKIRITPSVNDAVEKIKKFLIKKQFQIFADINHKTNAQTVNLDMPESRVLIFGNPMAGTKLMQDDIFISFDLPMRIAVVEKDNETYLLHHSTQDYDKEYQVSKRDVLDNIERLFDAIKAEVDT